VPVGLLSLLPLHAASEPGTPGDQYTEWRHAGNFSAIRYAPNARGLRRCRDAARELAERKHSLLAVDVPYGFGVDAKSALPYVARETDEATRRWTGLAAKPMHGCTWDEFRAAADDYNVWHLACHGSANPRSIMDSRLCFADRQVSLEQLRRTLRPSRRRLAVLSACETNLTDTAVPNEVVGLPSALIEVGFAGVVAASWPVDDLATTYLMTMFYQFWCQEGYEPAVALNRAQRWLRSATRPALNTLMPDIEPRGGSGDHPYLDPRYWAAFAYTGA
jgi:CHAT domain-containing protein